MTWRGHASSSKRRLRTTSARFRKIKGVEYISFFVKAYGDMSLATVPHMATRIVFGNDTAFLEADWRQTKHLALLAAPALVAIAGSWPRSSRGTRWALALAAGLLIRNLWTAWPLLRDFDALRPSSIW